MSYNKTLSSVRLASGLRLSLLVGTALSAWSVTATAQVAPPNGTIPDIDTITPEIGTQTPGFVVSPNLLAIDLDDTNVIITYNSFDLAADSAVTFSTADLVTGFTAVNLVNSGGGLSDIFGSISAQSNISVWLVNAEGVAFGSSGSFSGASLLVSTLPWANQGFGNLTNPQFATAGAVGAAPGLLIIDSGATLGTSGTPLTGSAIFISEGLTMDGSVNAAGDVVLVGTRDVSWANIAGSPLSFTVTEGVRVNRTDVGVQVTGSITGANIGVAAGGQRIGPNQLTAFILNISSSAALTATANNGSIILATANEGGITITNTVNAIEEIQSAGDLVTNGTTADIIVTSADGISLTGGSADATGDIELTTTAGNIAATGGFTITGNDVTIVSPNLIDFDSSTSIGTSVSAVNDVVIDAPGAVELGDVFANSLLSLGQLTLTEDVLTLGDVTTTQSLNVLTSNDTLTFASLTSTSGSVTVDTGTGNVAGGDIDAATFVDVDGDDVTLGNVDAVGAIDIDATGSVQMTSAVAGGVLSVGATTLPTTLTITGLASGSSVDLQASGAVNLAAVTSTTGNIAIDSTTSTVAVAGAVSAAGNYDVTGTVVTLGANGPPLSQTANGSVTITSTTGNIIGLDELTLQSDANGDGTDNLTLIAATNISFAPGTTLVAGDTAGTAADRSEVIVSTGATGMLVLGDVTARSLHTLALADLNQAREITLGDVLVDDSLTVVSTTRAVVAGNVTVRGAGNSLTMTSTLEDVTAGTLTADGAITVDAAGSVQLAGADAGGALTVGSGILPTDLTITGLASGTSVDLRASGLVNLAAVTSTIGDVVIESTTADVIAGDVTAAGNAFVDAGAGDDITLGDVNADSLSNLAATSLSANTITFDTITTTNELYLIATAGDITGNTIRTDGTDIRLTATDDVLITGAFTALSGDPLVSGSIGIFATDNVGSNSGGDTNGSPPIANLALQAGEDIAIRSSAGSIYLTDVVAGDDIFLTATSTGSGNGSVSFDSVELLNLNVDSRQVLFGASPGLPLSVTFGAGESPSLLSRTLEVDARKAFLGDIINVPGDLIITATDEAVFSGNVNVIGNFFVTGTSVTLGQNNQTRTQTATGEVRITATDGDITFIGDLTLQSNADGVGNEGLFLTARTTTLGNGDIGPGAGDTITLIGGTPLNPSPIIVALDGNFTANFITADLLSITDGALFSTTTPGSITIDTVDVNQSLALRSTGGSISVNTATVNNAGATLIFAAGGVGQNVISGTSLTTNNADILLTAAGNVDVGLVDTGPTIGSIGISSGGDTLVSTGIVAAEDILIEAGGDVGASGSPVDLSAGDDIRVSATTGTIFLNSAVASGLGPDFSEVSFINPRTTNANLSFGPETFFGADIVLSAANLLGPALSGSVEDALVVRDLSASSAVLTADLGEIRLGNVDATAGNLNVTATAGSVSGLANGWTNLTGGSTITAPGDITLNITGNAEIGTLSGATVTGTSFGRVTIGTLTAGSATLTAVNRLQVDDGTVAGTALFTTTGGSITNPSLTATPPVSGYGSADLSASGLLSVSALSGAAQLGTISADGVGFFFRAISVTAEAVDIASATTTAIFGDIELTATQGQLTLGTVSSSGALIIDKQGASGGITATGALVGSNILLIDSSTAISADTLRSTQGNIILESSGDLSFATALADVGTFTATTTLGSAGDVTGDRVRAQGAVLIDSDGAITIDGDPASPAIPGFTRSIQSVGSTVTLASGGETSVFSVEAAGAIDIDSDTDLRFDSLTGTVITLDAGDDISGVAGGGVGSDPLPGFGRGDVTGSSITIGALGTTGIVQLGLLDASGAVVVTADQIDISTIDAATIDLTSTLDSVDLADGDATGNITVIAATNATILDANSTGGNIAVTANGGDVTLTTGAATAAGGNITLVATGDVNGTTLTGGGNLDVDATTGDAVLTSAVMGGTIDVDAGANIRLGSLTGTAITLDAGDDISGLAGAGAGSDPLPGFLRGDVTGTTITIGATGTTDIVQLGLLDASQSVTVTAGLVDISTADAGTFIDIDATTDALVLGSGTAGSTIDLDKTGTAGALVAGILLAGGDITADSTTSLELADVTSTGGALIANATGAGGNDDAIVTLADTSGAITITSTNGTAGGTTLDGSAITVNGVSVDVTTAIAGTGGISATANGGDLFMGTGTSGADITLIKTGNTNPAEGLTATTLTAVGDIDLLSDTFVDIGNASAGGFLTIVSPQTIEADMLDSDGGIALNTGGDAVLGDIISGGTIVLLAAGDIDADTLTAAEDIAALAGGGITVGDFTAGDNVSLTAGTTLDLGGGSTTGGGADNATYVFDLAQAGDTSVTSTAITDGPADAVNGDVLLEAPDDLNLTGAIDVAAADGSIIVRNLAGGSTSTSVGTTGGFEITNAELGFMSADTVVVDSGDKPLDLGTFTVPGQSLQLLSTAAITLSGAITGTGTGTLQIGQGTIGADGLVDPTTLTESITAATDVASIDFAGGILDLRAVRIVFGVPTFVALTQGITNQAAGELLSNAGSLLYIGDNSQRVFLQADTLRVVYSDFALFQNTALAQGGGVILNADAANSLDSLALELTSQGDDGVDSFAIFGTINGFIGRTAGILPNTVLNIGSLSPRILRVTQARSRVNGCVIGSPDRGCLIVDLPPPEISTIDERQAQSLISTDDPSEFLNPLVGRGNEGLILDIAQIPVSIDTLECPEDDPNCQPTETVE